MKVSLFNYNLNFKPNSLQWTRSRETQCVGQLLWLSTAYRLSRSSSLQPYVENQLLVYTGALPFSTRAVREYRDDAGTWRDARLNART